MTEPTLRRVDVPSATPSSVPDVLAPGLDVVFCGINPGFHSDAEAAHFANPRNDFWRLLHAAGFTPQLVDPTDQHDVLGYGIGITNAAYRTTRGSSDLRKGDFVGSAERLEQTRREAGVVEEAPEVVPRVGEVRGRRGRDAARVDAAEDAPEAGRQDVRDVRCLTGQRRS